MGVLVLFMWVSLFYLWVSLFYLFYFLVLSLRATKDRLVLLLAPDSYGLRSLLSMVMAGEHSSTR